MICLEYPLPEDIREAEERQKKKESMTETHNACEKAAKMPQD